MAGCGDINHSITTLPSAQKGSSELCPGLESPSPAQVPECPICLQTCVHPVRLPCRHIFCFLCVKGASWQSKRCALCRQEVPDSFLERPTLVLPEELKSTSQIRSQAEHAWYYEGRNGWWQYDERTSLQLEDAFAKGKKSTEMLIAGFLYVADLENMVQYRRTEHGRRRKMKRDAVDVPKKGVAGLRLDTEDVPEATTCDTIGLCGVSAAPDPALTRPPTILGGLPENQSSPSLESSLAQLQISNPVRLEQVRSVEQEGVEDEDTVPSLQASFPQPASAGTSELESSCEGEQGCETGRVGQPQVRQRLMQMVSPDGRHVRRNHVDRAPPGGEFSSSSRSADVQRTVTEV